MCWVGQACSALAHLDVPDGVPAGQIDRPTFDGDRLTTEPQTSSLYGAVYGDHK